MARNDSPPFGRGEYESSQDLSHLLGREWDFEDLDYSLTTGHRKPRSGKMVTCRLVKNGGAAAILPKQLCKYSGSGGADQYQATVSGLVHVTNERGHPADEFLPTAGVPVGSYFFIVTRGPAMCRTPLAGSEFNGDISVGSVLVGLTAATSGATTAGRVAVQNITGSSQATDYSPFVLAAENFVGRALSAATTGQTNSDIFVDVGVW